MIELTLDQRRSMAQEQETPLRLVDPDTDTRYVLVREEVYNRVRLLFDKDDGFSADLAPHVMQVFGRDGRDDPVMDAYNDLDPRRQP